MVIVQGKQYLFFIQVGHFFGLFSGFGRCLLWEVDNVVEFVQICSYFMVNELFLNDLFSVTFPRDYCQLFFFFPCGHGNECCNLIGSQRGPDFPISDHGHTNVCASFFSLSFSRLRAWKKKKVIYRLIELKPWAAFSRPRSQFFTIRTSQPVNNIYLFRKKISFVRFCLP